MADGKQQNSDVSQSQLGHAGKVTLAIRESLLQDLTDRSGFDSVWDSLDEEIKEEIRNEWDKVIREYIDGLVFITVQEVLRCT